MASCQSGYDIVTAKEGSCEDELGKDVALTPNPIANKNPQLPMFMEMNVEKQDNT